MKKLMPRVAAINDISSVGKCSLTVVIPILSAMKIEAVPIVTAVLSAHTGFENPVIADMSDRLDKMIEHIESLDVDFDCVFSGYLSSVKQMDIVRKFMTAEKKKGSCIIVDPVLGDEGELYSGFNESNILKMRELCSCSDVITPNYTESCFLSGAEYREATEESVKEIISRLYSLMKLENIVITGVPYKNGSKKIVVAKKGNISEIECDYVKGFFCGTGDAFASVLCGNIINGNTLEESAYKAHVFVRDAIYDTYKLGGSWEQGIAIEKFLDKLLLKI